MALQKCDGELFCTVLTPNRFYFPRYYYTNKQIIDFQKRYTDIEKSLDRCIGFGMGFNETHFVLIEESVEKGIEKALFPNGDPLTCPKKIINIINRSSIFAGITSKDIVFLPSELSHDVSGKIRSMSVVKCFIVARTLDEKKQSTELFKDCPNVQVLTFEEVKDSASIALEEILFQPMKQITENLAELLETNTKTNIEAGGKMQRNPGKSKREMNACILCNGHRTNRSKLADITGYVTRSKTQEIIAYENIPKNPRVSKKELNVCVLRHEHTIKRSTYADTKGYVTRSKTQKIIVNEFFERIDAQRDSMERLLSEILGMYNRSKISEQDRPKISACLKRNVSDKVAQELYEIDMSVKSCGYRFSTLQVFVDDTSNKKMNAKIRNVLQSNGILKYEIVPSIDTFEPLVNVGAKCHPDPKSSSYGTVGGFATKSGNDLCALVSKHVAIHSNDGNVLLSDNQDTVHAQLIQETVSQGGDNKIDLSAAMIDKSDAKKCDKRFRDEDGDTTKGLDSSFDAKDLGSRNVHIWGASTSPGLGIITMPEIRDRYADNTYIVVEDRQDNDKAFCKEGDSGAMVCADDTNGEGVELISMVMGEDTKEKGKYATFRLDKGLAQLKRQTSEDFNLCKD